jgi:hypothetical protein
MHGRDQPLGLLDNAPQEKPRTARELIDIIRRWPQPFVAGPEGRIPSARIRDANVVGFSPSR